MRRFLGGLLGLSAALLMASPLEAHDGCHLTAEAVEGGSGFFLIVGSDFAADEEVELQVFMDDQPVFPSPIVRTADGSGGLSDGLTFTDADPVGEYVVTATADSCTAETTLEWAGLPDTATEAPQTQDSLPIGIVVAVVAGLLTFTYVFMRPSRINGRKE